MAQSQNAKRGYWTVEMQVLMNWFKFSWSLFLMVQWTMSFHWLRWFQAPNHYLYQWRFVFLQFENSLIMVSRFNYSNWSEHSLMSVKFVSVPEVCNFKNCIVRSKHEWRSAAILKEIIDTSFCFVVERKYNENTPYHGTVKIHCVYGTLTLYVATKFELFQRSRLYGVACLVKISWQI